MVEERRRRSVGSGLGGIVSGLGSLLGQLQDLAERGGTLSRSGELPGAPGTGDEAVRGVYGFTVKVGLGDKGDQLRVEPFGDLRSAVEGRPAGDRTREPVCDVFEEDDRVVVVAELPGVEAGGLALELDGDVLLIRARHGDRRYRKEVELGRRFGPADLSHVLTNGVLEVTLRSPAGGGASGESKT